jgi:uncharacterized protein (TIGR02246 family)
MSEDERAIRNLIATWMTATQAGDVERVLSLMADDIVFMVPGQPPFGKAEFAATSRGMKDVRMEGKSKVEELVVTGDWAWARTHITLTVTPPSGLAMRRSGYTLSIFRKKSGDDAWVLARDANLLTKE